jgi:hypothetical protein
LPIILTIGTDSLPWIPVSRRLIGFYDFPELPSKKIMKVVAWFMPLEGLVFKHRNIP